MEGLANRDSLERDAYLLRLLSQTLPPERRGPSASEREEILNRVIHRWPDQPSAVLRLAAVAHDLEERLDERFVRAPGQLTAWAARDPWKVAPDEAKTLLLAALVRLEQVEYSSLVPSDPTPMVLRETLTEPDDLATIGAMVRWEALTRLHVSTPDGLLLSWRRHVTSIAHEGDRGDAAEYHNTLDIRGHLQRFSAALSWAGLARWREHIEPVDDAFRACTERLDVPLALTLDARPGGWWRYRLPVGVSASPGAWARWGIEPARYVTGPGGSGLRTISHLWELAERPYGLRAMTDQELARWRDLCARQADAEARSQVRSTQWRDRDRRVRDEQRRRKRNGKH